MESRADRAEPVHDVVAATQAGLDRRLAARRPDPKGRSVQVQLQDLSANRRLGRYAEVDAWHGAGCPHPRRAWIVAIHDSQPSPGFGRTAIELPEKPGLRRAVIEERSVKVEVLRIEIREDCA